MPIRKRTYKSGKTAYEVNYYDAQGKRKYKVCPTLAHARNFEDKAKKERFEEKELNIDQVKDQEWETFSKRFLEYSKTNKKANTYKSHCLSLKHWTEFFKIKFPRGQVYLSDITLSVIEEYKAERLKKVSSSTVNRELACLKHAITMAEEWDMYAGNLKTKKIKLLKEPPGRLRYLLEDEMSRLIKEAIPLHLKVYYVLAFTTGMRKGEILGLKWENIDLENGLIQVEKTVTGNSPKSGKRREISIFPGVCDVLTWWKRQIGKEYNLHDFIPHYVPPVDEDSVFTIHDVRSAHRTACKKAGITNFRIHDGRHTAATLLRRKGTELDTLMEILGHSTIKMTMRYAHVGSDEKKEAAESAGGAVVAHNVRDTLNLTLKRSKNKQV